MPSDTDTESEASMPELLGEDDNRLSEDEDFPISDDEIEEGAGAGGMRGWAGSMAKVLKSDKSTVLSKAKKVEDVAKKKEKKSYEFEIEGEIKTEKDEKPSEDALKRAIEKRKYRERRENKMRVFNLRLKPSFADVDRERTFKKIATRGAVQLFNAVRSHQSEVDRKLQGTRLESKREEIIRSADNKKQFLGKLMSGPRSQSEKIDFGVKKEKKNEDSSASSDDEHEAGKSNWEALRNDFMTGSKVGWNKEDDDSDGADEEMESSDSD